MKSRKLKKSSFLVKNKRNINIAFGLWLVGNGFAFFPIKFVNFRNLNEIIFHLSIAYTLVLVGNIYKSANQCNIKKALLFSFSMNLLGLIIRIAVEYGEVSMTKALTAENVIMHIVLIPTLFTVGSLFKNIEFVKYD